MNLSTDPQTAREQLLLAAVGAVSFMATVSTVGFMQWYAPLLPLAAVLATAAFFVYRHRAGIKK